jgi:hypothetical protein
MLGLELGLGLVIERRIESMLAMPSGLGLGFGLGSEIRVESLLFSVQNGTPVTDNVKNIHHNFEKKVIVGITVYFYKQAGN